MESRIPPLLLLLLVGCLSVGRRADDLHRRAERRFQAGDFAGCKSECRETLNLASDHEAASALLLETRFILGEGGVTGGSTGDYRISKKCVIDSAQTLIEMDAAFHRGRRACALGELGAAGLELRRVVEYSKWIPPYMLGDFGFKERLEALEQSMETERRRNAEDVRARSEVGN